MHYRSRLQQHIAHQASDAANFDVTPKQTRPLDENDAKLSALDYWEECINKFEPIQGQDAKPQVYRDVGELFISPRTKPDSKTRPRVSMLLYGPPGTGKSSLAEELANALEWPLITITPSDFVTSGESEVEARAKLIFTALGEQSHCVVLFDEIDRLILDRDSPWYYSQSDMFQFMTPGMLPKLKALWKSKRLVFVIATNYEERIDPAAIRAGRVDERILVSPSDLMARKRILQKRIQKEFEDAGIEAPPLDDAQVTTVGKLCPLASYGEMESCVREVVESIDEEELPDAEALCELLRDRLRRQQFSLGMQAYRNRFNATREVTGNDQELAREPMDEFLVLVRTWLEADIAFRPQDKLLVTRVLAVFAMSNAINPAIIDEAEDLEGRRAALAETLADDDRMPDAFNSLPSIREAIGEWYDDKAIEDGVQ